MPDAIWPPALQTALSQLKGQTRALMLFGSHARKDHAGNSDVDLLQLASKPRASYKLGNVNVAVYDEATLSSMATQGSLFILHLVTEGVVLQDTSGVLTACLALYKKPDSYLPVFRELRLLADLLATSQASYESAWQQYNDTAIYILRTLLFATQAAFGTPSFSMRVISSRLNDPELYRLSLLKYDSRSDWKKFNLIRSRIAVGLTTRIQNPFGTIEALIVNRFSDCPSIVPFGLRILAREPIQPTYGALPV